MLGFDTAQPVTTAMHVAGFGFVARPLTDGADHNAAVPLTKEEVTYIHSQGLRILPYYNGAGSLDVKGDYTTGCMHGQRATEIARLLGVPSGIMIPIDVEGSWQPTGEFLRGYKSGMTPAPSDKRNRYLPGVYTSLDLYKSHKSVLHSNELYVWIAEWLDNLPAANNPPSFWPMTFHFDGRVVCWQYANDSDAGIDRNVWRGWNGLLWHNAKTSSNAENTSNKREEKLNPNNADAIARLDAMKKSIDDTIAVLRGK